MTMPAHTSTDSGDIHRSIDRTRERMDLTLTEVADRLHPRRIFDEVVALFRTEKGPQKREEYLGQAKAAGRELVRRAKEHPVPALLTGAAALWLMAESLTSDVDDVAEGMSEASEPWSAVAPWSEKHNWNNSPVAEKSWTDSAHAALNDLKTMLGDATIKAKDKLRHVAGTVVSLSGRQRRDIHAQWANLREHSGSFVDARTGKPYDDSYGKEMESLRACEFASGDAWSDENDENWSEKAEHLLEELRTSLGDTSKSARDHLSAMSATLGTLVGSTAAMASDYGQRIRDAGSRMTNAVRDQGQRMQSKVANGYSSSRDGIANAMDAYPLAFAGVCFGAGLITGALLPATQLEREKLGVASDELNKSVRNVVREGVERASDVAEAAMSAAAEEFAAR